MKFAKLCLILTACMLSACTSSIQPVQESNRLETVKARLNLALAYLEQQDYPKAKLNIDRAIKHDPNDYLPYSVLAYYYQSIQDSPNAEAAYQQAIKLSHSRPDVLNNYGTFLCEKGNFKSAYTQFERAIQSKQSYYHQADSLENIVKCAQKEGNAEKAQMVLKELAKLDLNRANELR